MAPFLRWTVGEVNWQCMKAGQANNRSIYLDVYDLITPATINKLVKKRPQLPVSVVSHGKMLI